MKEDYNFAEGEILLFDKPLTWTSFDVVKKVRNAVKIKKVGHAGTLDPLASGLLIICTGKFTKRINEIQTQTKVYEGEITLGKTTASYDLETSFDKQFSIEHITPDLIISTSKQFIGEIEQYPPAHSAIKIKGKRAYEYARKGLVPDIKPKQVLIHKFEIIDVTLPTIKFKAVCSKGTYIRSLAYDFGKALKSGAHLSSLRRINIGAFDVSKALDINEFCASIKELENNIESN